MRIVAFSPIKLQNERLPGKNVKPFTNGAPLCRYLFTTLLEIPEIDRVYAYCSDETICDFLPDGVVWLSRDKRLDDDLPRGNDIVESFIADVNADIYILAHVTSPFLSADALRRGIRAVTHEGNDSALSVLAMREYVWMNGSPINYDPAAIIRTQDLSPIYMETSGFFIFKKEVAQQHHMRIGVHPKLIEVSKIEAVDIDYPIDFDIANAIYNFIVKPLA